MQASGILLEMIFPKVHSVLAALVRAIIAVDTTHSMSCSHLSAGNLLIGILESLIYRRVIDVTLGHVIQDVADISKWHLVSILVLNIIEELCEICQRLKDLRSGCLH